MQQYLSVVRPDVHDVCVERRLEVELGDHPALESEVLELGQAGVARLRVGTPERFRDHSCRGLYGHVLEVDHQIVQVRFVPVDAEHLLVPLGAALVNLGEVFDRLLATVSVDRHRRPDAIVQRGDQTHLEDIAGSLEQELAGKPVVDAVAIGEDLAESRLRGQEVTLPAAREPLEEVRRHVEPS